MTSTLPDATTAPSQWRAEQLQLVNWGGFEGHNTFDFHPGSTLISGPSGTGKSTLLDAYLALMMPPNTRFNGASNDVDSGRARTGEQRSLLSYLRGQVDTTADPEDGTKLAKQLRGNGTATWGAISMMFVSDNGQRFTAMRTYHVPATASADRDIALRLTTVDGRVNLSDLEQHVGSRFSATSLKGLYPSLRDHGTHQSYATTLYTRLGIGANGDGSKAMQLLVRIQSGQQIRTVDALYKDLVLERPSTYEAADAAISEFDHLEASYQSMLTEEAKANLLKPIIGLHATLTDAQQEMVDLDTFGLNRRGITPMSLWTLQSESDLIAAAVRDNSDRRRTVGEDLRDARAEERRVDAEHKAVVEQHRDEGGRDLERLDAEIAAERAAAVDRQVWRDRLITQTSVLERPISDRSSFEKLTQEAQVFLTDLPQIRERLKAQAKAASAGVWPLMDRRRLLRAERDSLSSRQGRIPKRLNDLRDQAAEAIGLQPEDLPFMAELIDVRPEHTQWRTAIETVLSASALEMLVPVERLPDLSAALDPLQLRGRIRYHGAATGVDFEPDTSDPTRVAGKLAYKESPFAGWVAQQLASPANNAVCVQTARELEGNGYRVTAAGQTRRGKRGAHGRDDRRTDVIGFSNRDLLAEMDAELETLDGDIAELDAASSSLEAERDRLEEVRSAYEALNGARWDEIDVDSALARVAAAEKTRADLLANEPELNKLADLMDKLASELEEVRKYRFGLDAELDRLNAQHAELTDREDEVHTDLFAIEDAGDITLDPGQTKRLDDALAAAAAPKPPDVLADFAVNLSRMRNHLLESQEQAKATAERAARDLESIFVAYKKQWDDPNLTTSVAAYADHADILEGIVAEGLHVRHQDWRRRLTEWSGQSLVPLNGAMERSVADIQDRLDPINEILTELPFGADGDRLFIRLRTLTPEHVTSFRRQLKKLSGEATGDMTEKRLESLFIELQSFMGRLRYRRDERSIEADRDKLLDVRRHVEITAERWSPDGTYQSTYAGLGGKSGGESQELAAFIVGAALRFRLGDKERNWPRFAPVFLDEGFVKSDSEFAGRAVRAWQRLGFQLIVGAPLDKVTSLEPHMDQILGITKHPQSQYSFVTLLKDASAGEEE